MVESLLDKYTSWKTRKETTTGRKSSSKKSSPCKQKKKRSKKEPRTNKTKNGFKYKLKLHQVSLDSHHHPNNAGGVKPFANLNKVNTEMLRRNIKAFDQLVF